jgi:peptide/nickel transport system ATP-binding protein
MVPCVSVENVTRTYDPDRAPALDNVSLSVDRGRLLAVVGESGAGKSTLVRILAGLEEPDGGSVFVEGRPNRLRPGNLAPVQVVFQNPQQALDPFMSVGASIGEPLRKLTRRVRRTQVAAAMAEVGLDPDRARQRPGMFSGGQLQRAVLARALVADPTVLVCDEATSALDVSVQAQILNLVLELQARKGFACVFVTHDLGVARVLSTEIAVLRHGRVLEAGDSNAFFAGPISKYGRELLAAANPGR